MPPHRSKGSAMAVGARAGDQVGVDESAQYLGHGHTSLCRGLLHRGGLFGGQLHLRADHDGMLTLSAIMLTESGARSNAAARGQLRS